MFLSNLELGVCYYTLATQYVGYFGWKYGAENVCRARKAEPETKIFYVADEDCRIYHHILTVQESVSFYFGDGRVYADLWQHPAMVSDEPSSCDFSLRRLLILAVMGSCSWQGTRPVSSWQVR